MSQLVGGPGIWGPRKLATSCSGARARLGGLVGCQRLPAHGLGAHATLPPLLPPRFAPRRRLTFMRAVGPLVVCIISIALMNIFKW